MSLSYNNKQFHYQLSDGMYGRNDKHYYMKLPKTKLPNNREFAKMQLEKTA